MQGEPGELLLIIRLLQVERVVEELDHQLPLRLELQHGGCVRVHGSAGPLTRAGSAHSFR